MESTVSVGNHLKIYGKKYKQCGGYIIPALTAFLIEDSRLYDENYVRNGKTLDYKGLIPYVGSSVEKNRSSANSIVAVEH